MGGHLTNVSSQLYDCVQEECTANWQKTRLSDSNGCFVLFIFDIHKIWFVTKKLLYLVTNLVDLRKIC